jgi:predicted nucleotidyltransferase
MQAVDDAFDKFRTRLEITKSEQEDAAARHASLRDLLRSKLPVKEDFLTGSYPRDTKTKPLRDIDVFIVLGDVTEKDDPNDVLDRVAGVLRERYGRDRVVVDRPAVRVDFGAEVGSEADRVMSVEVVPAVVQGDQYQIADPARDGWMATDPSVHAEKATDANKAFDRRWKPLVKMLKKWNDHNGGPIEPSFLIEVMALGLVVPPWEGPWSREVRAFFASAGSRIDEIWPDPAGLGSPVSELLQANALALEQARVALRDAERRAGVALRLEAEGRVGAARDAWQELFGPAFAKS